MIESKRVYPSLAHSTNEPKFLSNLLRLIKKLNLNQVYTSQTRVVCQQFGSFTVISHCIVLPRIRTINNLVNS